MALKTFSFDCPESPRAQLRRIGELLTVIAESPSEQATEQDLHHMLELVYVAGVWLPKFAEIVEDCRRATAGIVIRTDVTPTAQVPTNGHQH